MFDQVTESTVVPGAAADRSAAETQRSVSELLDEAPTSKFQRRAVLTSGMGFFTDAYDLFVISTVAVLVKSQWHLGTTETSILSSAAILGAFFGALIFGRIADLVGRRLTLLIAGIVFAAGALISSVAPEVWTLIAGRVVVGVAIGMASVASPISPNKR